MGILHLDIKSANIVQSRQRAREDPRLRPGAAWSPPSTPTLEKPDAVHGYEWCPEGRPEPCPTWRRSSCGAGRWISGPTSLRLAWSVTSCCPDGSVSGRTTVYETRTLPSVSESERAHVDRPGRAAGDRPDRAPDARQESGRAFCLVREVSAALKEVRQQLASDRLARGLFAAGNPSRAQR